MHKMYNQLNVIPVDHEFALATGSGEDTGGLWNVGLFYDEWRKSSIKINPYFGRPLINDCAEKTML
jgi:hypothetical protein